MPESDDQIRLQQIALGNQASFQELYNAYYARLWRYAWYQLDGNIGWIEDVLQNIFLTIWQKASSFRGEAKAATWIFQIAHNLVSNARRDHNRSTEGRLTIVAETDDEGESLGIEMSFENAALDRISLIDAIHTLSAKQQTIIDLVFIQGFTVEEVAQIISVPAGTVKSRIASARKTLLIKLGTSSITKESRNEY